MDPKSPLVLASTAVVVLATSYILISRIARKRALVASEYKLFDAFNSTSGASKTALGYKLYNQAVADIVADPKLTWDAVLKADYWLSSPAHHGSQILKKAEGGPESFQRALERVQKVRAFFLVAESLRKESFDEDNHGGMLVDLWSGAVTKNDEVDTNKYTKSFQRTSTQWNFLGFQGADPQTDLRGGGVLALKQLHYIITRDSGTVRRMLNEVEDVTVSGQPYFYLWAVVGINFTGELCERFDIIGCDEAVDVRRATKQKKQQPVLKPLPPRAATLFSATASPEMCFHELYCTMLREYHNRWRQQQPHVMEFTPFVQRFYEEFFAGAVPEGGFDVNE